MDLIGPGVLQHAFMMRATPRIRKDFHINAHRNGGNRRSVVRH